MEKESLYILKLDTQGSKVKFPNADMPAKLGEYTYTAQRMAGTPTLTATLNYPSCLDELWTGEEFVEFRGEKYYIDQVPTSSKDNKSIMYKHELQFVSERIVLENVYFMDVVTAGEDTYHSNSTSVKFMGDINEFVGRLNASMAKSGIGYSIVIDEDITSESKLVSLDSVYLAEALQSIYTIYELPYYFVGKVCHIGYTENVISTPFEYKKGLVSIKKTNANYKTVNRVTGVGSSDNIPFYYPNDDEKGTIERTQNLMPSIYRQTNGAERFYNALNDTYKIPGTNDYYFFKNTYSSKKVKEIKVDFSDIKPTIENVTNASGQLFGEIADIAFDDNDSDELGTGEGNNIFNGTDEYVHSYFYIKLHIYNGDYGFNLFEQGLEGGTAVINMTTGNCAACEFEIGVTYKDNEPGRAFNPVLVDSSGNLPAGDFEQKVTSQTSQYIESQQNTSTNEVWIAVKKDNTTFGVVMPNATNNYKPSVGDKFVITGIKMPKSLVLAAEKRLDEALIKYMSENNDEKFSFSVSFSRVFLAEYSMLAGLLNENSRIYIKYNDKEYFMYVNSFTCKADKNCLYDISVELTDKLSANVSALRSTITEIAGDIIGERMGVSLNVSDILGRISRYFISKINNDTANELITFLKGIVVKSYLKIGEFITGVSGGYIDEKGNLEMESGVFRKRLFVPEIAYNRTTYFKGRMVNSPGGGCSVLSYVDNGDGTYTITPDLTDADGLSQFVDDILPTYFVTKNSEGKLNGFEEMKFRVTAADYTAKKFTVIPRPGHSDWKPAEQMVLAQTGNFTDPERQTYILIDSVNGNNCITFFDNANTWDPEPAQMPAWFGKKKGMTVNGIDCEKYSAVLQQVLLTGLIFQIDEITGNKVRVPLDKGEWVAGKYAYYDRVSHNGALWLCVDDNGTTTEPSEGNPAWLKQVAEGADGATGPQGVPGTPGKDGVTYYTWIRYADNAQGGGISNNPTGKAYIGFAYNKTSAVESNTPSDYTWSEIKGEQGVPGAPGADGKTYYTWIAYSDNADGTGMYQQPKDTTKYIGIAVNKETATESSNPSDYTWSLFKGKDGADGLSVIGGGHWESAKTPYKANTMVTLANCVFLSKVETSNPPIRILRVKGGNFLRKKDGGYYLAGKPADWEVNEDWDMLLDGRELKGESITFLGEFATAPANPKNGDSYRNTTDRATYIYQDGRWQLMISDGKDGKGYEYIYTRGNIIDNTPEKPDSQQKDGYVPEGWTDNYLGTDIDHQVEWGCTRFKENGVWSEFSDPAVVHRWSKDGENAIMADFDNEMVNAALTSDGKVVSSQTWNTTVSMWYGTEKLTLDSITCTPDTNLLCATDKNTGVVTISVSAGATLAATNTVKITIRATKNGQQYSRDLTFTVAGVRGGANGADAILYSIVVSASSVSKDKNGNYSVSSVSCYRQMSVGGVISTTTDGILKYSIDGGAETTINNNTAISSGNFTKTLKFVFYVNDQIVDVETVPMLVDGKDGADGESITAAGHWESANIPYAKNSTVSFAGGSYLSKVQTSNPPLPLLRVRGGRYLRKKDGGYILSGKRSDKAINSDWQEMTSGVEPSASYWLDSPVSTINFTSTGTPSPSAFVVTMKQNIGGNVSDTNRFYLVARKYNGSWLAHVGATLNSQISVPATAGYTQFAVRAYKSASDANAWNNNFVAEKGVGVAKDGDIGATGATGAFPRDRGVWASGQTYVWNADYRDKIIYLIGGVYYNFLVKNYGASVTSAPTSANGDSNWEAMQKFVNIATDTLFADGANVAGFMFKNNVLKSHNDEGETLLINGVTGYFKCKNAEITGTITADKGRIGPFSIASGILSSKILYENETNKYVGFNLSAGQIEFYNERTFANVRIGGNTQFVTIEGIKYDAGIDIQSPNAMLGMHIKTPSIPLFVEGGNIFLHPNNDSYVSIRGIVGNWRNISVKTSLNNNDDNVMFTNTGNIEVTLPPNVPGHTIYFKRMNGGVRLTGGRILPSAGGQEVSYIDLDYASGFIKCMGNYWVMFYCG